MRRRGFIALAGGMAAWPLMARAQQPAPGTWRIGVLAAEFLRKPLREGLLELGYVEGKNLAIEWRFDQNAERLPALAAELVGLSPNLIVALGTQAAQAAQHATRQIPIVMLSSNPVGNRLVASLAHPGGNITGLSLLSPELSGKRLELLRVATGMPAAVAVLYDPDDPPAVNALKETLDAAQKASLQVTVIEARTPDELASAFEKIADAQPGALVVLTSVLMNAHMERIVELALRFKLPSIYADPAFANAGGLMSYGPDFTRFMKGLATYIGRIFRGANPADLPVEQPTKFEFSINLKTADALGLTIPPALLANVDKVIE